MPMKRVPDDGPLDARIVAVGESPGANELIEGRPFVGASGRRLNSWLHRVGLERSALRVMNTAQEKVVVSRLSREEGEAWFDDFHRRLAKLVDPWLIVPMGNLALYALTGKGRVPWHMRDGRQVRPGITDWRGSILSTNVNGRQVKVIPTIHPAATFMRDGIGAKRAQQALRACLADWRRIAYDSTFRELRVPHSEHHINPTIGELEQFVREVEDHAEVLCVDIETPYQPVDMVLTTSGWRPKAEGFQLEELVHYKSGKRKGQLRTKQGWGPASIACVGFAYRPESSLTIPMRADTRPYVERLLALSVPKVMQNGFFDCYWLSDDGYTVNNFWWDTRAMHHCLTGDAKILLSDLSWKRLDEIVVGDELASFDEEAPLGIRKLRASRVRKVSSRFARIHVVSFSNGETLCGTSDHRFLVGTWDNQGRANGGEWKKLQELRTGDEIWSVGRPWSCLTDHESGWLAGFYDGEGSFD